ncbi:hypothetical protein EYC84_011214 [Monilinia fructicola]|uniref:NADH-ubiquinone oxidoreductase 12 kDa subunit, mitochondrial n=1 Tax=Monilinia fructicola TaxID=38448 RepID=A0A5M9J704_MONFR|nr:hypothetical protein EYC84_011214 [Monilinia fructicola]
MAPTPESAAFLAKKPTVPQPSMVEQWVKSMMARLVREELGKCYYKEGVNHLEKCGALRDRYFELLKESKIRGYLFEQQNYTKKPE